MSRKSRSQHQRQQQRHRARTSPAHRGANGTPDAPATRRTGTGRQPADALAYYRSLAAPSLRMRLVLVAGLCLYIAAQVTSLAAPKALTAAGDLAVLGMIGILVFLGSGFLRHQRALYRIRRENPDAWQNSMRFALSTLPVPLGFGGRPADSRERAIRLLTLALLLTFALTAIASSSKR